LVGGFDTNVSEIITEWRDLPIHGAKRLITLQHLLELTSGLSHDVDQIQGQNARAFDIFAYAVDSLRLNWLPGSRFQYGPSHYYAFGVFLQRTLVRAGRNADPLEYLQSRVLDPIGVQVASWVHDRAGNPHIPNGAYLTARNWIRFGQFLLQKGQWEGASVVSSSYMDAMRQSGGVNSGHGRFLWLNTPGGYGVFEGMKAPPESSGGFIYYDGYPDLFAALGAGKNRMYMIPQLDMVVLRMTEEENDQFVDHEFLKALLKPAG
jgi:CubicO group peptidase (beta-lactamase class C family)